MSEILIWANRNEEKILIWANRNGMKIGKDDLRILLLGIILVILIVLLMACGCSDSGWFFTPYAAFVAYYLARKRFSIADKQLKIATRREDLDQYMESVKLLVHGDETSQSAGVFGLTELLEIDSDEEKWFVKGARISLEIFLRKNWDLVTVMELEIKERKSTRLHNQVRDAVILVLCSIYRKGEGALDLSSLDMRQAELSGADLRGADLRNSNLSGAKLGGADLRGAQLIAVDLSDLNLSYANLSGMYLKRLNLSSVNLSHANLSDANLSDADLSDAHLSGAHLSNVNFKEVKGLDKIASYRGIWAYWGEEPKGLPEELKEEMEKNRQNR